MKIIDSFRFLHELDVLELRLNILYDYVDYFVITEATTNVIGNKKPLIFEENRKRFSKFDDKIIYNVIDLPNDYSDFLEKKDYHTAYGEVSQRLGGIRYIDLQLKDQREMYNREATIYGILKSGASDEDLIITSDLDEILNPLILENLDWFDPNNHYVAMQRGFYYKFNCLFQEDWIGSRICSLKKLKQTTVDALRHDHPNAWKLENGGWHFTWFGKYEDIKYKLESFSHSEHNTEEVRSKLEFNLTNNLDPLDRKHIPTTIVPIDDSYPEYILKNQDKYAEYIVPWN